MTADLASCAIEGKTFMRFNRFRAAVTLLLLIPGLLFAQRTSSNISGVVSDPSGAVVGGAKVTVLETATNTASTAVTNQTGLYIVTNLPPGNYTLRVEQSGFQSSVQKNIILVVDQ